MFRANPSKVHSEASCSLITACSSRIGSLITSCMSTPLICFGSSGSTGLVANGVLGLSVPASNNRSYCLKGRTGGGVGICAAVSFSEEPWALITGWAAANGVLLKEGNIEPLYFWIQPCGGSVGAPVKQVALPCASTAVPCGIDAILAMIWPLGDGYSRGYVVPG